MPLPVAVTFIDVSEQVRTVVSELFVMLTVGASAFGVISIAAVLVQPLSAVAVTVYVPPVVMALVAVVTSFDHKYEVPVPVASTFIVVVVQVSNAVPVVLFMLTAGTVTSSVITMLSVFEHPFASVTVTV